MKLPIIRPNVNRYKDELAPILDEILESNMLTNVYNYTKKFEDGIKQHMGVKNVVSVSSGTLGLILTLDALGVRNKEVIIPSFTFTATAAALYWTGNKITYADIDDTFTLDPEMVNEKVSKDTGAILPVHMYGNPCNTKALSEIAQDKNIPLVYDAAHALGSQCNGKQVGGFGDAEIFSLSPTKLLTSVEGGLITTNNDKLAEKLSVSRNYGMFPDYTSQWAGVNSRLSEVHSAVGYVQVKDLETFVTNRNNYVARFKKWLSNTKGISFQRIPEHNRSAHKDFSIVVDPEEFGMHRDQLGEILGKKGIGTKKYFYPPMHRLEAYKDEDVSLPMTDRVSDNVLSLPIYNYMNNEDIDMIVDGINSV